MSNKTSSRILAVVLGLVLFIFFLLNALEYIAYDLDYYHDYQVEHEIDFATGQSQEYLNQVSEDIVQYLQNGEESLMRRHFSENEVVHMVDVFYLFELERLVKILSFIILVLIVAYGIVKRNLLYLLKIAGITIGILVLIVVFIALFASLYWREAFTIFHQIFFTNDLWLMDPQTDLMIQMMPSSFFMGMGIRIMVKTIIDLALTLLVLFLIAYLLRKKADRKESK